MSILRGYVVIHEFERAGSLVHGVASSAYEFERYNSATTALEAAENQLVYCQAMQDAGRRGTDGRYFIAEYRELVDQ